MRRSSLKSLDELLARQARLEAERDGGDQISFPRALFDRTKTANPKSAARSPLSAKLFDLRRQARSGQRAQLKERSAQLQEEIKGYMGQAEAKQKEVDLIHQELEGVRGLWERNSCRSRADLARAGRRAPGRRAQPVGRHDCSVEGENCRNRAAEHSGRSGPPVEVGKDLIETRSKLSELAERKTAAVDQLNRIDIRAPQSGRVHELSVHTVGGVIAPGEQIMLIVPDADALAIDVKFTPRDIDQVYVGQTATMRFAAFNQKTTPEIDGKISVLSADITRSSGRAQLLHRSRLAHAEELAKLGASKLVPGMPVDVFIKTHGTTALSYLIKPLVDQAEWALKER